MNRKNQIKLSHVEASLDFAVKDGAKKTIVTASYGKIGHKFEEYVYIKKLVKNTYVKKNTKKN